MRLPATVVLLILALCAPGRAEEWTTYTDREAGFSVSYPADWEARSKPMPEAELVVTAPGIGIVERCIISHSRVPGAEALTPEQGLSANTTEIMLREMHRKFTDVALVEEGRRPLSGQTAAYLEATFRADVVDGDPLEPVRTVLYYTVANGGSYGIRCAFSDNEISGTHTHSTHIFESFRIMR